MGPGGAGGPAKDCPNSERPRVRALRMHSTAPGAMLPVLTIDLAARLRAADVAARAIRALATRRVTMVGGTP